MYDMNIRIYLHCTLKLCYPDTFVQMVLYRGIFLVSEIHKYLCDFIVSNPYFYIYSKIKNCYLLVVDGYL